jgi:long-chain acyl-CoA synthetase
MTNLGEFILHDDFEVLTPLTPELGALITGLREKMTIWASQTAQRSIAIEVASRQWLICETSGSTGTPKAIRRSPSSWNKSFDITRSHFGIKTTDIYATFGSLGHSLTLYAAVEAMSIGASLCCLSNVGPARQASLIDDHKVSVIYATPTQLKLLLKGAKTNQTTGFNTVTHVFCGGGELTGSLRSELNTFFSNAITYEFYGASETSFITISDLNTPSGSVGRPYPGVDVRIGDGQATVPFEVGEIWVRSPFLFDAYEVGESQDTRRIGSYLTVGEMGYFDDDGRLFVLGRKSRMTTVADNNVFLDEIERTIGTIFGIDHCAVIAKKDDRRGHVPVCFVQSGDTSIDKEAIVSRCRLGLGSHSVPREVHFVTDMPLLLSGKPDYLALQNRLGV